jgi:hypothetical protein
MKGLCSKLWNWIMTRSPKNASVPNVQYRSAGYANNSVNRPGAQLIETNVDIQSITGLLSKFGKTDNLFCGPDGELLRINEQVSILLGCGHVVTQLQAAEKKGRRIRGIAGPCYFCLIDYSRLFAKGLISALDAERLSLTCTECGKITTSGYLCCPKHREENGHKPNGEPIYIDTEHAKQIQRQDTMKLALGIVHSLFGQNQQEIPDNQDKEQKNAQKPIS